MKYNDPERWALLKTEKQQTVFVNNAPCGTTPKKYTRYFLNPEANHADQFFEVGYTQDNPLQLRYDMAQQFDISRAVDFKVNQKGEEKFSIFMELGVNKTCTFRTVWQKDKPESIPRIITGYRENRDND